MKVWIFYITDNGIINYLSRHNLLETWTYSESSDKYVVYAYTNKKKIVKEFMSTRNQKAFKLREVEMDEDEYKDFDNRFYTSSKLKKEFLITKNGTPSKFVLTTSEYWFVVEQDMETTNSLIESFSPFLYDHGEIFQSSLRRYLEELGFICPRLPFLDGPESDVEKFMKKHAWKNQLGLFIYLYHDILDINGIMEKIGDSNEETT